MIEGLYTVKFHGMAGVGGGVAVFNNGRVLGGDGGFAYIGSFTQNDKSIKAKVQVRNFDPTAQSVMGLRGNFDLEIEGTVDANNNVQGHGSLAGQPTNRINMTLARLVGLQ